MFRIIKSVIKFIIVLGMLGTLLFTYNAFKSTTGILNGEDAQGLEGSQKMVAYGRKAISMALGLASPLLSGLGVDVEGMFTEDSDIITRQMEESTNKLNEAMNQLKR